MFTYLAVPGPSCSMWGLVPWPGIAPGPPALGAQSLSLCVSQSLSLWTTRGVPFVFLLIAILIGCDDIHCDSDSLISINVGYKKIFMCLLGPFVCLWKNVYSGLLPIFLLELFTFWYGVAWAIYMFWILTIYSYNLQIFSPIQ